MRFSKASDEINRSETLRVSVWQISLAC